MTREIKDKIIKTLQGKKILILGFGKEGQSTYKFLRKNFPDMELLIADGNPKSLEGLKDDNIITYSGNGYMEAINKANWVMKSPGISFKNVEIPSDVILSSQTDLFIYLLSNQIVGVTGTKGKSTTVSLIYHLFSAYFEDVRLVGNIGIPALDIVDSISMETKIVYELSSHQLEFLRYSPSIAALLNLFEEHLDHYKNYRDYRMAKWQIALHQEPEDFFIVNLEDEMTKADFNNFALKSKVITISLYGNHQADFYFFDYEIYYHGEALGFESQRFKLVGNHNIYNLMVSLAVANLNGINPKEALKLSYGFMGLPHRLEFLGNYQGIDFVNDSIATIPQATINALKAVANVQTLILGGYDRGISYDLLIEFLIPYKPLNIMLLGDVGQRIKTDLEDRNYKGILTFYSCFDEAVRAAFLSTKNGQACLLSPAAASYDKFKNFEERGNRFRDLIKDLYQI